MIETTQGIIIFLLSILAAVGAGYMSKRIVRKRSKKWQNRFKDAALVVFFSHLVCIVIVLCMDLDDGHVFPFLSCFVVFVCATTYLLTPSNTEKSPAKPGKDEFYEPWRRANPWSNPGAYLEDVHANRESDIVAKSRTTSLTHCPKCKGGETALIIWKAVPSTDDAVLIRAGHAVSYEDLGLSFNDPRRGTLEVFCKTCNLAWGASSVYS